MRARAFAGPIARSGALLALAGCIVMTGPAPEPPGDGAARPLFRLGDVNVRYTGSWAASASTNVTFQSSMGQALRQGRTATLFTSDPAGLVMHVDLVVDHQDDGPRLAALGLLSMVTVGAIPLYYSSEWNAQCDVRVSTGDSREVARYAVAETGTYRVLALPPTMFTLLGAGVRGDADYKSIEKKIAASLSAKIYAAALADQARLAQSRESNVPTLAALGGDARALFERGRLYLQQGRREEARADLLRYAEADPRLFGALDESRLLEFYDVDARREQTLQAAARARAAEQAGDVAQAFREYQRAYALAAGDGAEIERFAVELARLYRALPEPPALPEVARRFFIQGQEQARGERYEDAAAAFGRVARVAPWYPQAHFNRALVLERLERFPDAIASMDQFLILAPDSEQARVARDRMYQWRGRAAPASPAGRADPALDGVFDGMLDDVQRRVR